METLFGVLVLALLVLILTEVFLVLLLSLKIENRIHGVKMTTAQEVEMLGTVVYHCVGFCLFGWWWLLIG